MKKFFKAASILAAVSMLFAFASCQQNPDEPSTSGTAPVFKAKTIPVDLSLISGVASVTEVSSDNEKVATATKDGAKVTVTSVAKGTAKITAKVTGADSKTGTAEISVTVAETGKITVSGTPSVTWDKPETPTDPENPGEDPVVPPTEPANPFAGKTFYGALEVSEGMVFDVVKLEFGDTTVKMTLYATVAGKEDTVETLNYTVADNKATITYAGQDITTTAIENDTFQATLDGDTPKFTTTEGTKVPVEPVDPPASENTITLDFGALRDDIKAQNLFTDGTKLTEDKTYVTSGVTLNFLASSKYSFKYNQTVGLTIKGDVFKITGIEGTYDAVVTWAIAGSKAAGDRTLSVNGGAAVPNADTMSASPATSVDNTCTVEGATGDLTFLASNEVVIKTIVITKK